MKVRILPIILSVLLICSIVSAQVLLKNKQAVNKYRIAFLKYESSLSPEQQQNLKVKSAGVFKYLKKYPQKITAKFIMTNLPKTQGKMTSGANENVMQFALSYMLYEKIQKNLINPQPEPPGKLKYNLINPQPEPPGKLNKNLINPQPEPPGSKYSIMAKSLENLMDIYLKELQQPAIK